MKIQNIKFRIILSHLEWWKLNTLSIIRCHIYVFIKIQAIDVSPGNTIIWHNERKRKNI